MRNKYNAKKTMYNGRKYDSKMEADYAIRLDWMKKAGEIKEIIPQFKISLDIDGQHICNYIIDFKIIYSDDLIKYIEVKGVETALFKLKWKLVKILYPFRDFELIKKI